MLWPIVQEQFTTDKVIRPNVNLDKNTTNASKIPTITLANFKPQLIRLNNTSMPIIFAETTTPATSNNQPIEDDSHTLEADIGILTHLYLQLIAENGVENWSIAKMETLSNAMRRWFKQKAYDDVTIEDAVKRVHDLLATTLASDQGQWVLQNRATAASELAIEFHSDLNATKKIIDRTFIEDGTRWIIDYKSIGLAKGSSEDFLKAIAVQYQAQLDDYARLFESQGLPIQKAIFFVSIGRLLLL